MSKIRKIKLGTFNYSQYPLITFTVNEFDEDVKKTDIEAYMSTFKSIVDSHEERFILLIDCTHAKWIPRDQRDYFGVAIQLLEEQYHDRHSGNYVYISNFKVYLLAKLIGGFLKTKVPVTFSFNKQKLKRIALEALSSKISHQLHHSV